MPSFKAVARQARLANSLMMQERVLIREALKVLRARFQAAKAAAALTKSISWSEFFFAWDPFETGEITDKNFVARVRKILGVESTLLSDNRLLVTFSHLLGKERPSADDTAGLLEIPRLMALAAPGEKYVDDRKAKREKANAELRRVNEAARFRQATRGGCETARGRTPGGTPRRGAEARRGSSAARRVRAR